MHVNITSMQSTTINKNNLKLYQYNMVFGFALLFSTGIKYDLENDNSPTERYTMQNV